MNNADSIYVELQKHLDKQAVGFPATKSGVEIRILKYYFTPEQAGLALHLNYQPQSIEAISKSSDLPLEKVKTMLEEMAGNGAIGDMKKDGEKYYYTMPLLIGMLEWGADKVPPQFWKDYGEYMSGEFGKAYANTKTSQMRTVPVEKSIQAEHHVTTYDHIREIIKNSKGPISVNTCGCREGAKKRGQPCHVTSRSETCMSFGDWARHWIDAGHAREVTREEALEITRQNEADGLVLQPTNYQKIDFVCACCGDCCGILRTQKILPKPAANWAHNFYAAVDTEKCSGCGTCAQKCQVNAAKINEQNGYSTINLDRCIGCGNCVAACPSEALRLVKIEKTVAPPEDRTALYKILAER